MLASFHNLKIKRKSKYAKKKDNWLMLEDRRFQMWKRENHYNSLGIRVA